MEIVFCSEKLRKLCNSSAELRRKFGPQKGKKIEQRLSELRAAATLDDLSRLPSLSCHPLKGKLVGKFAITTVQPFRMVFEPAENPVPRLVDGGVDRMQVTAIRILEVDVDYHD